MVSMVEAPKDATDNSSWIRSGREQKSLGMYQNEADDELV